MKSNKGFTLLEIISVVTLIVVLSVIIIPIIDKNIKDAQKLTIDAQIETIENAAFVYVIKYRNEIPELDTDKVTTILLQTLLDKGLLDEKSINSIYSGGINSNDFIVLAIIDDNIKTIFSINQELTPYIALHGPEKITMEAGTQYNELGAVLLDFSSDTVVELDSAYINSGVDNNTPGTYTVIYNYPGSTSIERTVVVATNSTEIDNEKPVINLIGLEEITISKGSTYEDSGATATDIIDGDISSRIVVSGTVNPKQKGIYYIKYDVTDLSGNKADTVIRTVSVN